MDGIKSKVIQRKICHANTNKKKAEIAILISDKADIRARRISKNKEALHNDKWASSPRRHDMHVPNNRVSK
jgi:hypothetical protein